MSSNYELYTKDTRVWIPDVDNVWKGAVLIENYKQNDKKLKVETDDGNIVDYDLEVSISPSTPHLKHIVLPPLRNPEILIGQNDLTSLSYLNEPEVLYNLEVRFLNNNQIYTYCGIVLVAINPYEQLPIYGNEIIQAYNGCDVQHMDPHIFAVSEEAFQKMRQFGQNQSIIVSGESGAGKTVSAKYAMRYFANVGGSSEETQIEKKVLASNPIMEAFGNAKTTRNDNSSRFGKFIQIDFSKQNHIIGASMKTYLLEKSRVVFQANNERNYHIFYQLCSQRGNKKYSHLKLSKPEEFIYTNQGDASIIDNIDDSVIFKETIDAFNLLGINTNEQDLIFNIISSIMHLGNVKLIELNNDQSSCSVKKNDESLAIMCKLLMINEEQMKIWLCNKRIKTASEVVNVQLSLSQAYFARDALAKHMYSQLFNWIVNQINKCLKSNGKTNSFIGVLDIYGFETFKINSFEQFCINYANEKLQQQFCQHVFKLEQEEYMREQIKWSFIEFYDNQPCIDLIEGKLGILDLLDEECKMPKGSDITWCNKLYDKHLKTSNHFSKPRLSQKSFIIHHFAEHVEYQADGFLEKNRDTVLEDQLKVIKHSESDFIAELFLEDGDEDKPKGYEVKKNTLQAPSKMQINRKKTVGSQFRESLQSLMTALNSTIPHYVRCIKPNDLKASFKFDVKRAVEQLRACGVLETVRISAAGYPSRWTYLEFFQRYRMLAHSKLINRKQLRETCEKILITLIKDQTKYQFGKTKIFFQAGQVAYLEKLRSEKLKISGITIQKHIRGWLARSKYLKIKKSILLMQKFSKGVLARRLLKYKRETRAAILIQSQWRSYKCRLNYKKTILKLIKIQAYCRGFIARKNRDMITNNIKATKIQSCVRGWLQRIRYRKILRGIVLVQSHYRRRKARKLFKIMKIEMKSVEHQRQLNKGLENKIISLQQNIEKINKEKESLNNKVNELEPLKQQLNSLKMNANTNKDNQIKLNDLNEQLNELKNEIGKVKKEKEAVTKEKEEYKLNLNKLSKSNDNEISSLRMKLEESEQKLKLSQLKIAELTCQLAELQSERANHQKLIKEHSKLETRFEKARSELLKYRNLNQTSAETTSVLESLLDNLNIDKETTPQKELELSTKTTRKSINDEDHDYDIIKSQEFELENHRLRDDLNRLRKLYDDNENESVISNEIKSQFNALNEELQKRRDECVELKTILVNQSRTLQNNHDNNKDFTNSIEGLVTEGNEYEMAYSSQKILNRMLENQLQESQKNFEITKSKLIKENKQLKEENERQHEILFQNLPPETLAEETYKYEIGKLSDENYSLRERCEELCEEAKKYKKVLKVYIKKSKQQGNQSSNFNSSFFEIPSSSGGDRTVLSSMSAATLTNSNFEATATMTTITNSVPQIKFKNGECMGVLEWKLDDQEKIINRLIYDLKPRLAVTFLPGTPSYILFMCIRYADILNDDERVRSLLDTTVTSIKKLIKKRQEDLEYVILWLANLCRLLHNLKQYSGETAFQTQNTPKQNEHCLKNFDLTEYRGILSDIAIWLFQGIIKDFEKKLLPLIVPAMLEYESLPGMTDAKPTGLRGYSQQNEEPKKEKITIDTMIKKLNEFLKTLNAHGVDPEIVDQIFKQLFFFIGSNTFNNLILRKEMCHWSKGIEIRFNLSHLEQWIRDSKLQDSGALQTLEPIIQASQLLQARKTESDIKSICDMCPVLTIAQIQRILFLYTPVDEYEEKLSRSFIDKVVSQLRILRQNEMESTQNTVVVDTQLTFPICIPFNPSSIGLETIEIPEQLNISGFLKKL